MSPRSANKGPTSPASPRGRQFNEVPDKPLRQTLWCLRLSLQQIPLTPLLHLSSSTSPPPSTLKESLRGVPAATVAVDFPGKAVGGLAVVIGGRERGETGGWCTGREGRGGGVAVTAAQRRGHSSGTWWVEVPHPRPPQPPPEQMSCQAKLMES